MKFTKAIFLTLLLGTTLPLLCQDHVAGQAMDTDSQVWAYGTWSAKFVSTSACIYPPSPANFSGSLDGTGSYGVTIPANSQCPSGQTFAFTFCPNAGASSTAPCAPPQNRLLAGTREPSVNFTVPGPRFTPAFISYGYTTAELTSTPLYGWQFWNSVSESCTFWNGSSWLACGGSNFGNGEATFTAPNLATFSDDNFGGSTSATTITPQGVTAILFTNPGSNGSNTNNLVSLLQSIPTPANPWTVTARIRIDSVIMHYDSFGLVMKDTISGNYQSFAVGGDTGVGQALSSIGWISATHWNGDTQIPMSNWQIIPYDIWLRWQYDGTNVNYYVSRDGNTFALIYSATMGSLLPNNPSQIGIGMNTNMEGVNGVATPVQMVVFSWKVTQP